MPRRHVHARMLYRVRVGNAAFGLQKRLFGRIEYQTASPEAPILHRAAANDGSGQFDIYLLVVLGLGPALRRRRLTANWLFRSIFGLWGRRQLLSSSQYLVTISVS